MSEERAYASKMEERGQDREQSKMDDAFVALTDRMETLGQSISVLEKRLGPVTNDYPRPPKDEESPMKDPGGDSSLLLTLYRLSSDIRMQEDRIRVLTGRLDI